MEILNKAVSLTMIVFVVSCMLAVGLSLTVSQVVAPLRNARLVTFALLANFVFVPLAAIAIARLLRLDEPLGAALVLLGTAAGAPFLPLLAGVAKGHLAFSVGLTVLLMVLSVAYMPLVLPLLLSGVSVDPAKIASSLLLLMLLPLGVGLAVKAALESVAARLGPLLSKLSTFALVLLMVLIVVANIQNILSLFGSRGILASILFLVTGSIAGWFLGGPVAETRSVMSLGTAQRNIAAALVVAKQNFSDARVVVMVVVVAIVGLVLLFPFARWLAKRSEEQRTSQQPTPS
jgi:bile acid:Na+ symporter, BASS family